MLQTRVDKVDKIFPKYDQAVSNTKLHKNIKLNVFAHTYVVSGIRKGQDAEAADERDHLVPAVGSIAQA